MTPDEKEFFERLRRCKTVSETRVLHEDWARKIMAQEERRRAAEEKYMETEAQWWAKPMTPIPWTMTYRTLADLHAEAVLSGHGLDDILEDKKAVDDLIESTRTKPK